MARDVDSLALCLKALLCKKMFHLDPMVPPLPFNEQVRSVILLTMQRSSNQKKNKLFGENMGALATTITTPLKMLWLCQGSCSNGITPEK